MAFDVPLVQQLTRTPLLLLQLLFIPGWYVVLRFADEKFGLMFAKALGLSFVVGSCHNLNAFLLWRGMQLTRAGLEARVSGEDAKQPDVRAQTFVSKNAMSMVRFFLIPLTVSLYSMRVSTSPECFRLFYPVTRVTPEGPYDLELMVIITLVWALASKAFCAIVEDLAQRKAARDAAKDKEVAKAAGPPWSATIKRHTEPFGFQLLWALCFSWLYVMAAHMTSNKAAKLPVALLLCSLVGASLNVNGFVLWKTGKAGLDNLRKQLGEKVTESTVVSYATINTWTGFRFFFVPFCVSTFSIVSSGSDDFVYLFPVGRVGPVPDLVIIAIILVVFFGVSRIIRTVSVDSA